MAACPFTPHFIEFLIGRERARIDEQLSILIQENVLQGGSPHGFLYGGKFHTRLEPRHHRVATKKLIEPPLRLEAQAYLDAIKHWETDRLRLQNSLPWLFSPCQDWQDVRDTVTEMTARLWPQVSSMARTREPGWAFEKPLEQHRFKDVTDLIELHVSNRIL